MVEGQEQKSGGYNFSNLEGENGSLHQDRDAKAEEECVDSGYVLELRVYRAACWIGCGGDKEKNQG